jgi:hypothetical protein
MKIQERQEKANGAQLLALKRLADLPTATRISSAKQTPFLDF